MSQGSHTWPLYLQYHACPSCGFILENRSPYENRFGKYIKELSCKRCNKKFVVEKIQKPTFGPFTGDQTPAEMEWDT